MRNEGIRQKRSQIASQVVKISFENQNEIQIRISNFKVRFLSVTTSQLFESILKCVCFLHTFRLINSMQNWFLEISSEVESNIFARPEQHMQNLSIQVRKLHLLALPIFAHFL